MFGHNRIRGRYKGDGNTYQVHDVFHTIQGEGPFMGRPAVFIRLTGCNLRCHFCFVPSTPVLMSDGSKRRIDEVSVGDEVMSWDGEKFVERRVTRTHTSVADEIVKVEVDNRNVWCTPDHPFLTRDGWVNAEDLTPQTKLVHWDVHARMTMHNPGHLSRMSDERKQAGSRRLSNLWKDPEFRAANVERMRRENPMRDPAVAAKAYAGRERGKISSYEKAVLAACEGLPIRFVGDGSAPVAHKFPDFIVEEQKKLIEVWAADSDFGGKRGAAWVEKRRALFARHGYDTLFLPLVSTDLKLDNRPAIRERVARFINNGAVVRSVTRVGPRALASLYGKADADKAVHNLEVEGTHTFVANSLVVHNCDTQWDDDNDPYLLAVDIAKRASEVGSTTTRLAVVTGGEPCRHDLKDLILELFEQGFEVQIETAGTIWQDCLAELPVTVVVSPKTSKVRKEFYTLRNAVWKYVIRAGEVSEEDGLPIAPMQRPDDGSEEMKGGEPARPPIGARVYLQPCDEQDDEVNRLNLKAVVASAMAHGYTAGVQMHKIMEVD